MKGQLDRYIPCRVCAGMGSWMGPPHRVAWWDRPDGRCLEMLERTRELLNYETMELQPLTLERWKAAVKSKKASSTVGLDTVSRRDLMAFPDSLHQQLLDTCEVAETKGIWPRQLLHRWVRSLAKVTNAERVGHYRPITVMPFAY